MQSMFEDCSTLSNKLLKYTFYQVAKVENLKTSKILRWQNRVQTVFLDVE
jgi:hypothetical protein